METTKNLSREEKLIRSQYNKERMRTNLLNLIKLKCFKATQEEIDEMGMTDIPNEYLLNTDIKYFLVESPVHRIRKILIKYAQKIIKINEYKKYFLIYIPLGLHDNFYILLNKSGCLTHTAINVKITDKEYEIKPIKKSKLTGEEFYNSFADELLNVKYIDYEKPKNPKFFLFFPETEVKEEPEEENKKKFIPKRTLESFIKFYESKSKNLYHFYTFTFILHIILTTNIHKLLITNLDTVRISAKDIKFFFPPNYKFQDLINGEYWNPESISFTKKIEKSKTYYYIKFNFESLKFFNSNLTATQRVELPYSIIKDSFKPTGLGKDINFLLLFLFPFSNKNNRISYKPSTILKYSNISKKEGILNQVRIINKRLQFLEDIGLLKFYKQLTKKDILNDTGKYYVLHDIPKKYKYKKNPLLKDL